VTPFRVRFLLVAAALLATLAACGRRAEPVIAQETAPLFNNGGFEAGSLSSWTVSRYWNSGITTYPPQSYADLNLQGCPTSSTNSACDWVTFVMTNAVPESQQVSGLPAGTVSLASPRWPKFGTASAVVNQAGMNRNVNSLKQQFTTTAADVDPADGKIHARFALSPQLQDPGHTDTQQPYFFAILRNVTKGTTLYQTFNYSNQPGIPWNSYTPGSPQGSYANSPVRYTDWQVFDIAPGNAAIWIGDTIEIEIVAAGCSLGGHWGQVWVDGFGARLPSLSIAKTAPQWVLADSDLTYTFQVENATSFVTRNVYANEVLPANTRFKSIVPPPGVTCTTPAVGTAGTGQTGGPTVTCPLGWMNPASSQTFQVTVHVDPGLSNAAIITNGNYSVQGDGINPILGAKVETHVGNGPYADLAVAVSDGVPAVVWGGPVSYTITATNYGPTDDPAAVVTVAFPSQLTDVTWTCAGTGVATCKTPSGTGDITAANGVVSLKAGETATFSVNAKVISSSGNGAVAVTAHVKTGPTVNDSNPANNDDTDLDSIGTLRTLTVTKVPSETGQGQVVSSPLGLACGNACTQQFLDGSQVTLTAIARPGDTFTGWTGGCTGLGNLCTVALSGADVSVAAHFRGPVVTGSALGGHGTVACAPSPAVQQTSVACIVAPDPGYLTSSLTDNGANVLGSLSTGSCTISGAALVNDHDVVATFIKAKGTACGAAAECATGLCVDGVCCDGACTGQCQACNVAGKAGTCSPVPAGGAPVGARTACPSDGTLCGGACDGVNANACAYPSTGTSCQNATCAGGLATGAATCDGAGRCPLATHTCGAYVCGPTDCLASCSFDGQCAANSYCDTGSGKCVPQLSAGKTCTAADQCLSGFCADGVCCDGRCDGQCEACALPGKKGTCSPAPTGAPVGGRAACASDGSACGGACDGTRRAACVYPADGVSCRPPSCSAGTATLAAVCDGQGACPSAQTQVCTPLVCGPTVCTGTGGCASDSDCAAADWCSGGACVPRLGPGVACGGDAQCASGHCVDGVCCDSACHGQCEACDLPGRAGTCSPVTGAPEGGRPACDSDGSACGGACDGTRRTACAYPLDAVSCRAASCTGGAATLAAGCDGAGHCPAPQTQPCAPYLCDSGGTVCAGTCTVNADCAGGTYCAGGVCAPRLAAGARCGASSQCASGHCVDGVCCDAACSGQCEACDVPGSVGTCTPTVGAPAGVRPACVDDGSACGGACDGSHRTACIYPNAPIPCRAAACSGGVATLAASCDGSGRCPAPQQQTCDPYSCAGATCAGTCIADGDCAGSPPGWCSGGVCVAKLGAGRACARAGQCGSGSCVDGVCCDRACNGTCEACDVPGHVGACTPVTGAPHGVRPQCATDGSTCGGACDGIHAGACSYPGVETTCRAPSCTGGVSTSPASCDGSGLCPSATQVACQSGACDGAMCVASDWKMVGGGCSSAGTSALAPLGLLALLLVPLRRRRGRAATPLVLVLALLAPAAGRAETAAVDAQRFDPQGGAYDLLAVPSARVADHLAVSGGFLADYAAQPVRLVSASAGRSVELVKGMTSGSLTASVGLLGWSELSLTLPMALSGSGQPASAADPRLPTETPAAGVGDLRVTPRVSLVSPEAGIRVALLAPVSFPTGSATYQSAGTIVAVPTAALELGAPGGWRLLADAGVRLRQDQSFAGVDLGTAFVYAVAGEVPLLGGRVAALATLTGAVGGSSDQPLEALAAVRVRGPAGLEFTLGGGPGLSHAYGTPQYRVVAGLQFARKGPPRDPEVATVSSGPRSSPSAPAPATASATTAQKATAGITAAPVAKGAAAGAARPSSTGTKTAFVTRAPEPLPRATLAKGRIVLREPVQFVEGREDLVETSAPAIDEVATLLRSHPEIALLKIEVHTDDDGAPDDLLALSRRRANAIRSRLMRAGVAAGRLEARGYGDTRPLTTNYSARDRAINRRVELVVARTVPAPR